ncbi:TIR domain-containing protein [Listeria booriae]|uniref:toll/interleukin-1 receptor domain-containing protein n=1 Tax=Listeria booriae TaxID=1552123 RepID=UPI001626DCFC|nr:toll/interleukin-1 receptor domain-containing protein [Listeria booriae]MBC1553538.1 TIR domain-containing protein [Listeria booriae]
MVSVSMLQSRLNRYTRDLTSLENKKSSYIKSESDSLKKINDANRAIQRTKSESTIRTKTATISKEQKKIADLKKKQAGISSDISKKQTDINKTQIELTKANEYEQRKIMDNQKKELEAIRLSQAVAIDSNSTSLEKGSDEVKQYDVFISHANEDKDYVNELVLALKSEGINIWYDSDSVGWGKSIRRSIDDGLKYSRFAIVILSPHFISESKYWTGYELDGLFVKEGAHGEQVILPIWHNITADQMQEYSLSLSDRLALNTAINTVDDIVNNLIKLLR